MVRKTIICEVHYNHLEWFGTKALATCGQCKCKMTFNYAINSNQFRHLNTIGSYIWFSSLTL